MNDKKYSSSAAYLKEPLRKVIWQFLKLMKVYPNNIPTLQITRQNVLFCDQGD